MAIEFKQILLGDMIAVEMDGEDENAVIKLPEWQGTLRGRVIGVGPGAPQPDGSALPMMCQLGDHVVFGPAAGMESRYQHTTIRIMRDEDVDAVLEDE